MNSNEIDPLFGDESESTPTVIKKRPAADKHFENSPLNCLRCRHCEVRPETDFSRALKPDNRGLGVPDREAIIPIFCAKTKRMRPAHIFTNCSIADGRYHAACRAVASKRTGSSPVGDRCKFLSGPERIFLRLHWPLGDILALKEATARSTSHLRRLAKRYEFPERNRLAVLEGVKVGLTAGRAKISAPRFNEAQKAYIAERFENGNWPKKGNGPSIHAANAIIRAEIVTRIAELGHPFPWDSIASRAHESQPGHKRWRKQWDHANRRKGRFVQCDGTPAPFSSYWQEPAQPQPEAAA